MKLCDAEGDSDGTELMKDGMQYPMWAVEVWC
jgi:hypothetical protein